MEKLLIALTMMLVGCSLSQAPVSDTERADITPKTPLGVYQKCMGYSDKTIVHTSENPGRYIVLVSKKSPKQSFFNKQEEGQVYSTSLLECKSGNTITECSEQPSLKIRNIGTKNEWQVGSIKKLTNADFVFDKTVSVEFLKDDRFLSVNDYCYIDRNNITKSFCRDFIRKSDWRSECKGKMTASVEEK